MYLFALVHSGYPAVRTILSKRLCLSCWNIIKSSMIYDRLPTAFDDRPIWSVRLNYRYWITCKSVKIFCLCVENHSRNTNWGVNIPKYVTLVKMTECERTRRWCFYNNCDISTDSCVTHLFVVSSDLWSTCMLTICGYFPFHEIHSLLHMKM